MRSLSQSASAIRGQPFCDKKHSDHRLISDLIKPSGQFLPANKNSSSNNSIDSIKMPRKKL